MLNTPHTLQTEMLSAVLEAVSFIDFAGYWDGTPECFDDLPELPDLRELSICDLITTTTLTADLLAVLAPVQKRNGTLEDIREAMLLWVEDAGPQLDPQRRDNASALADWVIRVQAQMETVRDGMVVTEAS